MRGWWWCYSRGAQRAAPPRPHRGTMAPLPVVCVLALALVPAVYGGAYLGCFDTAHWLYTSKTYGDKPPWTLEACEGACAQRQQPLVALGGQNTECLCGAVVPNGGAQLDDASCRAGAKNAALLYYRAWGERCRHVLAPRRATRATRHAPTPCRRSRWQHGLPDRASAVRRRLGRVRRSQRPRRSPGAVTLHSGQRHDGTGRAKTHRAAHQHETVHRLRGVQHEAARVTPGRGSDRLLRKCASGNGHGGCSGRWCRRPERSVVQAA
jgi:hypothetical protein